MASDTDTNRIATRAALGYAAVGLIFFFATDLLSPASQRELAENELAKTLGQMAFIFLSALGLWSLLRIALREKDLAMRQALKMENRLRLALTASGGFLWQAWHPTGGALQLTLTGGLARTLGLEGRDLTPAHLALGCHPSERDALRSFLTDVEEGTIPPDLVCRLGSAAQGWRWVKLVADRGIGPETEIGGAGIDISDQKGAAKDLAEVIAGGEIGTWRMDLRDRSFQVNERWAEMLGYSLAELGEVTEAFWRSIVHPEDLQRLDVVSAGLASLPDYFFSEELRLQHRDGHWVWVHSRGRAVEFDEQGAPTIISGVHLDIGRRKSLQVALRRERDFLQGLAETSASGILAIDESGVMVFANRAVEEIFATPTADIIGRRFDDPGWDYLTLEGTPLPISDLGSARVLRDQQPVREQRLRLRLGDGRVRAISMNAAAMKSDTGRRRVVCSFTDITEQLRAEEALRDSAAQSLHAAQHDHLTGLPNRGVSEDRLTEALALAKADGSALTLVFLDLDNFKQLNDRFGHQAGDVFLRRVAERLEAQCGADQMMARVSGDEFTCLSRHTGPEQLPDLLRRLNAAFDQPFDLGTREVYASASFGVAIHPCDASDARDLWRNADLAMHEAKARGRNQVVRYSDTLKDRVEREARIAQILQRALRDRAFSLVLQPVVVLSQPGTLAGAEVLLRCDDPGLDGIGPGDFMPVAERHGLVRAIDLLVIDLVGEVKVRLAAGGLAVRLSVNLSPDSLRQPEFGAQLLHRLKAAGLGPADVTLELTEGTVMDMTSHARDTVEALIAAGYELSADDFGTGYSSLAYLHQLRLKEIKIDRSFISRLGRAEGRADEIVRAIIAMAEALGLRILAEGVETADQAAWLGAHGCSHAQGFLFSPGLSPGEFLLRYAPRVAIPV